MSADDQYEKTSALSASSPTGDATDNGYVSRTGQSEIHVQKDEASVEDPIDPATADSDETLARDEQDVIDSSNIMESRTRGVAREAGHYTEPGDEEGLPGAEDGTSAVTQ